MTPRRKILAAVLVGLGAIAYGLSPVDIIPELLTGPLGLIDDAAVWGGAAIAIVKLLQNRKPKGDATPTAS